MVEIRLTVNGAAMTARVHPMARLLDVLREDLRLTGTKEGCGEGECGACSVLLDGQLVNSCLTPALQADGSTVTTIEGVRGFGGTQSPELSKVPQLHALQQAFLTHGGAQCGICTPGMILAAVSLLEKHPHPTEEEIRAGLSGNLCRCTGYMKIFDAIVKASGPKAQGPGPK